MNEKWFVRVRCMGIDYSARVEWVVVLRVRLR
jgi:hypothetical protein